MDKPQNKFIKYYYDFFDKKLSDSSIVVGIIGVMIFVAGYVTPTNNIYAKRNILEYKTYSKNNIVVIGDKEYKLILEEMK